MEKNKIAYPELLNDLVNYSKDRSLEVKVKSIYFKCIRARKINIADQIKIKYPQYFKVKSDALIAFEWLLRATKKPE